MLATARVGELSIRSITLPVRRNYTVVQHYICQTDQLIYLIKSVKRRYTSYIDLSTHLRSAMVIMAVLKLQRSLWAVNTSYVNLPDPNQLQ